MSYIIITPVKNEEKCIAQTIQSVLNQTIKPSLWLIVDDGSTDKTRSIIKEYASSNSFIRLLSRPGSPARDVGYGGIRAFNYGAQSIDLQKFDYIVNLDGDVSFGPDYFEKLFRKFDEMPDLGIAGGLGWNYRSGRLIPEKIPENHVPGYTKVYRKKCYFCIQPIRELPSWDSIDELMAQRLGWTTLNFKDIRIAHLKPMTLSAGGTLRGKLVQGRASYAIGYSLDFMILRSIKMMFEYPFFIGGTLALVGYLIALASRDKVVLEKDLVEYLRQKQRSRLKLTNILSKLSG